MMTPMELAPANTLLAEHSRLRDQLDREGFLFFRGLLPPEEVMRVRRGVLECCRAAGWLVEGSDPLEGRASRGKASVEPEPAFIAVYREVQRVEVFHALAHHPVLLGLAEAVTWPRTC